MNQFASEVAAKMIPCDKIGVFFLGQAGFLLKTPNSKLIAVDPYLSNCCERYFGFKRLMPRILEPGELSIETLLVSHAHYDHFDPDSVPAILSDGKTALIGAKDVEAECERLGLSKNIAYLSCGESAVQGALKVTGVPCDHGELAPDALGLLIEIGGKKIYYMGDTAYRPDYLENPALQGVDLLLLPINGKFGNLNEREAAQVIKALKPQLAVPCHYWNFAEHGGNPGAFQEEMERIAPDCPYLLMRQGEGILI
ncbi:MAG: MBL fold metallo-hydrolase [Clostridia bacterium]|nr:MBL fold metallo-hydrolase [Clostridia bacterium]